MYQRYVRIGLLIALENQSGTLVKVHPRNVHRPTKENGYITM